MANKNIWVAAGDGDLDRVQELVEQHSMSPNVPDPFSYTPMHAAASYGHVHILEYLLSRGGDVNVTDNDGDTPLYTVEDIQTARFLVEHGAVIARQNLEGVSPIGYLMNEFPDVAEYLRATLGEGSSVSNAPAAQQQPSQHMQNNTSEDLTTNLISQVQQIFVDAEAEGNSVRVDERLRSAVSHSILEGIVASYPGQMTSTDVDDSDVQPAKPTRLDDGKGGTT